MASCQRCNNLLPRTVDQCPVCGLEIMVLEQEPEFTPPSSPGWAAPPSSGSSLTERLGAGSGVTAPVPIPEPTGPESADPPFDLGVVGEVTEFILPEPITEPSPISDPGVDLESDDIAAYQPPSVQMASMQQPNFRQAPSPSSLSEEPVDHTDHSDHSDLPLVDGSSLELEEARTVRALSARVGGDVTIGKSKHHQLISSGLLGVGVLSLGFGALLSMLTLGAEPTVVEAELPTFEEADDDALSAFVETHQGSVVEVRSSGCGELNNGQGVMPDATTVLLPYSTVVIDSQPVVVGADGKRVLADLVFTDPAADLAILQTRTPIEGAGLNWSGSSQSQPGSSVVVVESRRPGSYLGSTSSIISSSRNNSGRVAEHTMTESGFWPGSAVLDAQGRLVGIIASSGDVVTSAEVLSALVGTAKTAPRSYEPICPEPVEEPEADADAEVDG